MVNTISGVRPTQHPPLGLFPQYQFYRPGLPPTMLQSTGMPPTFYYSIPGPGPTALGRPPPTPVMQARSFHRATSVSLHTPASGPQSPLQQVPQPQQSAQQTAFSPAFITTTVQPLPPPGRGVFSSNLS